MGAVEWWTASGVCGGVEGGGDWGAVRFQGTETEERRAEGGAIRESWMCSLFRGPLGNTIQKYSLDFFFFFLTRFSAFWIPRRCHVSI